MKLDLLNYVCDETDFTVTVTITKEQIEAFHTPPSNYVKSAKQFMEQLKTKSEISFYEIYEDSLQECWERMEKTNYGKPIRLTLARGCPDLQGLSIEWQEEGHIRLRLPEDIERVKQWKVSWILQELKHRLISHREVDTWINPSQLEALWIKAALGIEFSHSINLLHHPLSNPRTYGKDFTIKTDMKSEEIFVTIGCLDTGLQRLKQRVLHALYNAVIKLRTKTTHSGYIIIFEDYVNQKINKIFSGPQVLNVDLPITFIGAISLPSKLVDTMNSKEGQKSLLFQDLVLEIQRVQYASTRQPTTCNESQFLLPFKNNTNHDSLSDHVFSRLGRGRCQILSTIRDGLKKPFYYKEALASAFSSIDFIEPMMRAIHSITSKVSIVELDKLITLIEDFERGILDTLEPKTKPDHIFQCNLQFFPLTAPLGIKRSRSDIDFGGQVGNEWLNVVMKEIINLRGFKVDPKWIADILYPNVTEQAIKNSLALLARAGLIQFDPKLHKYSEKQCHLISGPQAAGENPIRFHRTMLQLTETLMTNSIKEFRVFKSLSVSSTEEKASMMFDFINRFFENVLSKINPSEKGDFVYQLNIQFFPLVKLG